MQLTRQIGTVSVETIEGAISSDGKPMRGISPIENVARYNLNTFAVDFNNKTNPPKGWCIYTDGSKTEEGVGLGWIITNGDQLISENCRKLEPHSSVYEAEMQAVIEALKDLGSQVVNKPKPESITVLIDNQATLHTVNKLKVSGSLGTTLINTIENVTHDLGISVHFQWIKSHVGTVGNELADELAKQGTTCSDQIFIPPGIGFHKARDEKENL